MVRQTSIKAFEGIHYQLGDRQQTVYEGFLKYGDLTNLELSIKLKLPINQVTPRTNELVKLGLLVERIRRPCTVSGRNAIVWTIT